jgi:hypothetical protein
MIHIIFDYVLVSYLIIVVTLTIIHDKKAKRRRAGETNHSSCNH